MRTDYNNLAPRLGLAFQVSQKTVLRSGFGVFYGRDENIGINRRLATNPPFINLSTYTGSQTVPATLMKGGIPPPTPTGG